MTDLWKRAEPFVLGAACVVLIYAAGRGLGDALGILLYAAPSHPSLDYDALYRHSVEWFAGRPVYQKFRDASYPPATFVLLWPLVGWTTFDGGRLVWAVVCIAFIVWFVRIAVVESRATTFAQRLFVGLMIPSLGATRLALGNGQPVFFTLVPVVAAILWLYRRQAETRLQEARATLALVLGFIKPHLTIPLYLAAAVAPSRRRVLIWVAVAYLAITAFALAFQPESPAVLIPKWIYRVNNASGSATYKGSGPGVNLHAWMGKRNLREVRIVASFGVLAVFAVWVWFYRRSDVLLHIGIGAAVARFWTYHRPYDDVLMVLPAIALFRIAAHGPGPPAWRTAAGTLLAVHLASLVGLHALDILHKGVLFVWPVVLAFLMIQAHLERSTTSVGEPAATVGEGVVA